MAKLLNKDDILIGVLQTLVQGWGKGAVSAALEHISSGSPEAGTRKRRDMQPSEEDRPEAAKFVESKLPLANQELLLRFAEEFDRKLALPKLSDVRRFLASHHVRSDEIKTRNQAFRHIFILLQRMSEKGLLRALQRARFSGPAQLDDISDAIKGAGSNIRDN